MLKTIGMVLFAVAAVGFVQYFAREGYISRNQMLGLFSVVLMSAFAVSAFYKAGSLTGGADDSKKVDNQDQPDNFTFAQKPFDSSCAFALAMIAGLTALFVFMWTAEKYNFMRENMVWIMAGILALAIVLSSVKKAK